jgi:hypothetical protein
MQICSFGQHFSRRPSERRTPPPPNGVVLEQNTRALVRALNAAAIVAKR